MSGLRRAREEDITHARAWMDHRQHHSSSSSGGDYDSEFSSMLSTSEEDDEDAWTGEVWDEDRFRSFVTEKRSRCVVLIDGYAVDVTHYLGEHVSFSCFPFLTYLNPFPPPLSSHR